MIKIICKKCECYDHFAGWLQGCQCICHIPQEMELYNDKDIWSRR